jgi:glycosyltransferase involved in cell wall biosynthesis
MDLQREVPMDSDHLTLFHITTVPETLGFFRGQIGFMKEKGFQVHAVSSPGELLDATAIREDIQVHAIEMPRFITPLQDIGTIINLTGILRQIHPDIVHAHTPKGGLLGVISARLARVPVIIYGMHGLPFVTAKGWKRRILCWSEAIACRLADKVISVGAIIREKALAAGFCQPEQIVVLGAGSVNGVDATGRFNPEKYSSADRIKLRQKLNIPEDALVIGFVGRIVKDKGIVELSEVWGELKNKYPDIFLLLVGPVEPQDPLPTELLENLQNDSRVRFTGHIQDIPACYTVMDIMVLPTYREGFPVTPLEAAAMKIPIVATDVDGCPEAVENGITGALVPSRDSRALAEAIEHLILNPEKRHAMGQAGRERVLKKFKPEIIWQELYDIYLQLLHEKE